MRGIGSQAAWASSGLRLSLATIAYSIGQGGSSAAHTQTMSSSRRRNWFTPLGHCEARTLGLYVLGPSPATATGADDGGRAGGRTCRGHDRWLRTSDHARCPGASVSGCGMAFSEMARMASREAMVTCDHASIWMYMMACSGPFCDVHFGLCTLNLSRSTRARCGATFFTSYATFQRTARSRSVAMVTWSRSCRLRPLRMTRMARRPSRMSTRGD